jgi:hypothetical protein
LVPDRPPAPPVAPPRPVLPPAKVPMPPVALPPVAPPRAALPPAAPPVPLPMADAPPVAVKPATLDAPPVASLPPESRTPPDPEEPPWSTPPPAPADPPVSPPAPRPPVAASAVGLEPPELQLASPSKSRAKPIRATSAWTVEFENRCNFMSCSSWCFLRGSLSRTTTGRGPCEDGSTNRRTAESAN